MVNTGKPSQGCGTCRARRIKCDERKPYCFRCEKSKRVCVGYRGVEYPHTFSKSDAVQKITTGRESMSPQPSVAMALLEDQAACFFVKNFVLLPSKGNSRHYMDYLIPVIKQEESLVTLKSTLSSATMAVALALLGNSTNSHVLQPKAAKQYARALRKVNEALRDPVLALEDHTLASVLMLGIFELVTGTNTQPTGWCSHADGATMLVKLREEGSQISPLGRTLHVMARSQMVVNSIICCTSPLLGVDWWMQWGTKDGLPAVFAKLHLQIAETHAESNNVLGKSQRRPNDFERVIALIAKAKALEEDFIHIEKSLPAAWQHTTAAWVEPMEDDALETAAAYPGRIDGYLDISIATAANMMRAARIILSSDILRLSAWLCGQYGTDYRLLPEYLLAARHSKLMIEDIIASVPSFLTPSANTGNFAGKTAVAMFTLWPLLMCMLSDFATDSQSKWLSGRLRWIAYEMGIRQAELYSRLVVRLPSMMINKDNLTNLKGKTVAEIESVDMARSPAHGRAEETDRLIRFLLGCET